MNSKILIIDDEAAILHALQLFLEQEGYLVDAATKYDAYLENLDSKNYPDLIILDILLMNEDGRKIAKQLKSNASTKDIPIIMISAHYKSTDEILKTGADAFLPKPFDVKDLLDLIEQLLSTAKTAKVINN